jgi:hypothetical protein
MKITLTVILLLFSLTTFSQKPEKCYTKQEIISKKIAISSMIITTNLDTLYTCGVVSGRECPFFDKKITGQFIELRLDGSAKLKAFILKGRLIGYYCYFDGTKPISEGYFYYGNHITILRE